MADESLPLRVADPAEAGIDSNRWRAVPALFDAWCGTDRLPAAGILVGRHGKTTGPRFFGRRGPGKEAPPIGEEAIFLVASITKPIVGAAVLILAERGLLALDDRVETYVPAFGRTGKHAVTLRHLLTHTSGLPDMLPNNTELRAANAPLSAFVSGACECPLDFLPGTRVQYQSMGFALLGEVIHQVSGKSCARFLHDEVFEPLGMRDTALGTPPSWFEGPDPKVNRIAGMRIPAQQEQGWDWNSPYWRRLGVPWGGLFTTPTDLGRLAQLMLGQGSNGGRRILSPATVAAATRTQLEAIREVPENDRRTRVWGFGWRLNGAACSANFGDFLGPRAYGHWGATGTLLWIDPDLDAFAVLLSTEPYENSGSLLQHASNAITASFV